MVFGNRFSHFAKRMQLFCFFVSFMSLTADDVHIYNLSTHVNYTDLQSAINAADSGNVITVSGKILGNFEVNKNLTLIGKNDAVLDGNHAGTVLTVGSLRNKSGEYIVNVESLTILNGHGEDGGGIKNYADLTLNNVKVLQNTAAQNGGGIYSESETAKLTLNNVEIAYNTSTHHGAGIFNYHGALVINNSKILHNVSDSGRGGGIANFSGISVVTVTNTEVEHNSAPLGFGGGFYAFENETALTHVNFKNNNAAHGGAVFNDGGSVLGINNCRIEKNIAVAGAGLLNQRGAVSLSNSEVEHNSATSTGGGIVNYPDQKVNLIKTKVSQNNPDNILNG